ncbi:unnamed protein product [Vitrella brassicaformis CCMP3155]|uniref:F-box domain-containing protein n=1 Tax=Vitrella brassicaformis (strain CCMP3155) TaxID=1169540 RepID=A0A0G4FLF3_VITBC|nr:unnamed protein product [Vitrella brassicaformis CCMP3155]|mmetsp:Transcript_45121/g.127378  ORF Transcript_45121/g.127378 Transcript_45121/m.127378 type:complete len:266 (+) Transcript_45121:80-877(+)|eukprot:CEM14839.1 unnamed protein product [Vitrella brassicaformis CCMP3155]
MMAEQSALEIELEDDLLLILLEYLDVRALGRAARTCRRLRDAVTSPAADTKVWKPIHRRLCHYCDPDSEPAAPPCYRSLVREICTLSLTGYWRVKGCYDSSGAYEYDMRLSQHGKWVTGTATEPWIFEITGKLHGNSFVTHQRGRDRNDDDEWTNICSAVVAPSGLFMKGTWIQERDGNILFSNDHTGSFECRKISTAAAAPPHHQPLPPLLTATPPAAAAADDQSGPSGDGSSTSSSSSGSNSSGASSSAAVESPQGKRRRTDA